MRHVIRLQMAIPAPPDAVRAGLRDLPSWPNWDPYIVAWQLLDGAPDDPWRPGSRSREEVRRGPFRSHFDLTAVDAGPAGVGWQARYLFVTAPHYWHAHAQGAGTLIVSEEVFEGPAPLIAIAAVVLRLFRVRSMTRASLEALRDEVIATR